MKSSPSVLRPPIKFFIMFIHIRVLRFICIKRDDFQIFIEDML